MKKLKLNFAKIFLFILAVVMPISVTGVVGTFAQSFDKKVANAETSSINYYKNYVESVSLTNNNFNSSIVTSISQNPSGWTKQVSDSRTTAGIISTGNNFDNYKNSTYYLSVNPKAKSSDSQILMINSKTSKDDSKLAREGYESNSLTLSANSFYSFQVAFKSDSNYIEDTTYIDRGTVSSDVTIYQTNFNDAKFGEYVSMNYHSSTYYAKKDATLAGTLDSEITSTEAFYYDGEYVGFLYDFTDDDDDTRTPIYVKLDDVTNITVPKNVNMITNPEDTSNTISFEEDYTASADSFTEYEDYLRFEKEDEEGVFYYIAKSRVNYTVRSGAEYYTCSITFNPNTNSNTSGSYKLASGEKYFSQKNDYISKGEYGQGSIYVDGLKDADGNNVDLCFEKVISTEWTTFYFFVATGDSEQTINLELWLGSRDAKNVNTIESTGVVFFDDVKVKQYSENYIYETYFDYLSDKTFGQNKESSVKFSNLNTYDELDLSGFNFDFEDNSETTGLTGFKKSGKGNAMIVPMTKDEFENLTGHDFAGSSLKLYESYDDEGNLVFKDNNNALALWADDNYVEVTAKKNLGIDMHGIYKITVDYKLINVEGTAYLKIQESENVYALNNISEDYYELSNGSVSGTSNGSSNFNNQYNSMSFFVKGSHLYNSELEITLALGSSEENATGCVVFDDIRVEKVDDTAFEEAENKVELGTFSEDPTVENGYFNIVTQDGNGYPLTPSGWTIENNKGFAFGGVINTKKEEYEKYENEAKKYEIDSENPYLWATWSNPKDSSNNDKLSNNILMLANLSPSVQSVTSPTFSLNANSFYKLNFKTLTRSIDNEDIANFKLSVYNSQDVLLFEKDNISSPAWSDFSVYFQTFEGAESLYVVIELGTANKTQTGFVYLDNFTLETIESNEFNTLPTSANKVDMTNYYLNLPTNTITDNLSDFHSYAYTGSSNSEDSIGGIVNDAYFENDPEFMIEKENDEDVKLFVIQTNKEVSHTIESAYNFDLTSGGYYKLSFKLKTRFIYDENQDYGDFDINEHSYGATVGLTGFDYMSKLKSNNEYTEYTLYIHPTEDATAKLHIALVSDHAYTTGIMVVYDINFEDISTDDDTVPQEYTSAQELVDGSEYDINTDRVAIAETADEEDTDDDTAEGEETDEESPTNDYAWLLYVSSIITALAIIVAILGYYLRKIKIKKIEIKRKETYDRKGSLHRDIIRQEAEQERAQEVEKLESDIKKFETELENIEKEHKDKVVKMRKDERKVVSKSTEKEFKLFAQKRDVLAEKIDILKHQLENVKSPEHLLSLERKKFAENEAKQKQLEKETKTANKKKDEKKKK